MGSVAGVTLTDEALRAGVSQPTASRVLNGSSRRPSPAVVEAVRRAAEELGYIFNAQARALARSQTGLVGLVVHDITDPYFSTIAAGVQGEASERDLQVLGVYPEYLQVRNLVVLSGRFFDKQDSQAHNKVGIVTQELAEQMYGSQDAALGKTVKLSGLPFTIVGIFRERVDTFGQSEVSDNTMLIPYSVIRYFQDTPTVKQIYFSTTDASMVLPVTAQIQRVIQSRHRPESVYKVENLTQLVAVADKTANALTMILLAVALVVLLVSGIGIMNIMLATVSQRIREIGIRKAIGATNREIRFQFLSEAVLISLIGGLIGIFIGLAIPFSVRFFTEYRIPISGLSAIIAIVVSSLVGIIFGTLPASRAAQLDPVESLRYE